MTKLLLLLAVPSALLFGQTTGLTIASVTAQQAIVQYSAPDASPCALAATDNSGLNVTVWDVSGATFSGAGSDLSRSNTVTWNEQRNRQILLGARSVQAGSDGKLYSRSLQANTAHTLTVTCSGGQASVTFNTLNPPVGATYPDPQSFHAAGFGNAAWPTVDWTSYSTTYIDPKTGIALRPATWWGRYGNLAQGNVFGSVFDPAGTWTNSRNLVSGSVSAPATSGSTNPVFVSLNKTFADINGPAFNTISDIRLSVTGNGSSATPADRQIDVCLYSHDTGDCDTPVQRITLNRSTNTTVAFPASNWPSAPFRGWGTHTWVHNLVSPFSTVVDVNGTAVTNKATLPNDGAVSKLFNTDLLPGDKVMVNGTLATVDAVISPAAMTLREDLGKLSGATLTAANFGVRIAKSNANGTVDLSLTYDVAYESLPSFFIADGASAQCSPNTFSALRSAAGATVTPVPARLCIFKSADGYSDSVHIMIPSTGEMRFVGLIKMAAGGEFGLTVAPRIPYDPFDTSDPRAFYVVGYSSAGSPEVARLVYRGNGKDYGPQYVTTRNAMWGPTDGESTCVAGEIQSGNLCMKLITKPGVNQLLEMVSTMDPRFGTGMFGNSPQPVQVLNGKMILFWNVGQDTATAFTYLDLATGRISWISDTFTTPGARWGAMHTASAWVAGTRHGVVINTLGRGGSTGPMTGPYSSAVKFLWNSANGTTGTWNANTGFDAHYSYPCPASSCGVEQANTLRIRIAGTPCSKTPGQGELATYPCPWNPAYSAISALQVGDRIGNCDQQGCKFSELFEVLRIVQTSTTDWDVWLKRGQSLPDIPQQVSANGWVATAFPSGACNTAMYWYDVSGADRNTLYDNCSFISGAHIDVVNGPVAGKYTFTRSLSAKYSVAADSAGFSTNYNQNLNGFGTWAGLVGNTNFPGNGNVEDYPSLRHFVGAPTAEKVWAADYRGLLSGTFGSTNGGGQAITGNRLTPVTTGGRTKVWKFISPYRPQPKKLPMDAFAGRWYFKDISGPSSNITDSDVWSYCVVYTAGECLTGATTVSGEVYFSAPNVVDTGDGACWTNQFDSQLPCFIPASPIGDWALQWDISRDDTSGFRFRRLTQAFAGSGRVTNGTSWRPSPDGKWGFVPSYFADGVMPMMWTMTVPPWPGYDGIRRDDFLYEEFKLGPGAPLAEIRFGYEENGTSAQFFCTSRKEGCATRSDGKLFNFLSTDGHSGVSCATGCSVRVPAISGRVLWWQAFRSSDSGATWTQDGPIQPKAEQ
jgi:hypothetical protein